MNNTVKIDEYIANEAQRTMGTSTFDVVYDYVEPSPYYDGDNAKFGPYIDEKELIELPNPT